MRTDPFIFAHLSFSPPSVSGEEIVRIIEPWDRVTILAPHPGAAYLTVKSARDERLFSAVSPVAGRVMNHAAGCIGSINRMVHLDTLDLPCGNSVKLNPDGKHLMLMVQNEWFTAGEKFAVTLRFEGAGELTISGPVLGIGAKGTTGSI